MADRTCPNGHVSEWDDYCSHCGAQLDAPPADPAAAPLADAAPPVGQAAAPARPRDTNAGTCPSCGAVCLPTDLFCEACGADLAAGTPVVSHAGPGAVAAPESVAATPAGEIELTVDREYFDRFVDAGQLAFPDPPPVPATVAITKDELLVGRRSESRGVYPDIDAEVLTGDPAVSHRHLLLTRGPDGRWSVTDQGSTNGSRLGDQLEVLDPGRVYPLAVGDVVHVGAWTTIRLT